MYYKKTPQINNLSFHLNKVEKSVQNIPKANKISRNSKGKNRNQQNLNLKTNRDNQ